MKSVARKVEKDIVAMSPPTFATRITSLIAVVLGIERLFH